MIAGALAGKRVLIAEDSWHVAHALKMTVESEGAEVVGPVPTVARAVDLAATNGLDLALVDMNLRDELAFPLLEALGARGVKCVVLTGYRDLRELTRDGVSVLGKPVQPDSLIRAMCKALS